MANKTPARRQLNVRVLAADHRRWRQAAKKRDMTLSAWIVYRLNGAEEAERAVKTAIADAR